MTRFLKMHGLGNDFAVFDARNAGLAFDPALARAVADRKLGIGCDQVIVIARAKNGADAAMRIFNADGGEVESCGNAARCVAKLLLEEKVTGHVRIETIGGPLACDVSGDGLVTVDMGPPRFGWREIPLAREVDTKSFALVVPGFDVPVLKDVSAVSVGNPHCVLIVADPDAAPVATLGPAIERHRLFPKRTNVEFVSVIDRSHLRMRVWERGVGITPACGTGACAAAVAAMRRGLCESKIEVMLDGGPLSVEWLGGKNSVLMTGPASLSFAGEVDLAALERAR